LREHCPVGRANPALDHTGERYVAICLTMIRMPVDRNNPRVRRNVPGQEKRRVTAIAPYFHQPFWFGAERNFQKHDNIRERRRPTAAWKLADVHYPLVKIPEEIGERKHRQSQPPP
jgi:hypothetical protein